MRTYLDFRQFYNQVIHPELSKMERLRRQLLKLLAFSILLLLAAIVAAAAIRLFVVTLLLLLPVGFWIAYLLFKVQGFYQEFKPRIVELLLDFIDNDVNYSELKYKHKGMIPKKKFLESRIFLKAQDYEGEDLIEGRVRETPFMLSELRVKAFSPVRSKLDNIFSGVFVVADFHNLEMKGSLLLHPDEYKRYLLAEERAFHLYGGRRQHGKTLPEFETWFNTYATPDLPLNDVLSTDFQKAILDFRLLYQQQNRKRDLYLSIIGDNLYIGITQDRDLLEPSIWRPTVDYTLAKEFHDDIALLLQFILRIDVMN